MKKRLLFVIILFISIFVVGCSFTKKTSMANTTWIARDKSEVIFSKDRIDWYHSHEDHSNDVFRYSGTYKFYIGKKAVKHITEDLPEYGVTVEELESIFATKETYDESNFVFFDISYDLCFVNGEAKRITNPTLPWMGFLLDDGKILDVANIETGSYYYFEKQS